MNLSINHESKILYLDNEIVSLSGAASVKFHDNGGLIGNAGGPQLWITYKTGAQLHVYPKTEAEWAEMQIAVKEMF